MEQEVSVHLPVGLFTGKLIAYSMQLAMLSKLLNVGMISKDEYCKVKNRLMKDYKIVSDLNI